MSLNFASSIGLPILFSSIERKLTKSSQIPFIFIVAVSKCFPFCEFCWIRPILFFFGYNSSFINFAISYPFLLFIAMSMSMFSLFRSLSRTHPPATRNIVSLRWFFSRVFLRIKKISFSVGVNIIFSIKLLFVKY